MLTKILSWNVNRLNSPNKHEIIQCWLKKQKADIICLQETHIKKGDWGLLVNNRLGQEFFTVLFTVEKKKL